MKSNLLSMISVVNAGFGMGGGSAGIRQDTSDGVMDLENNKAYKAIFITIACVMFLVFIDLWFISTDGKERIKPYYLEETDTEKRGKKTQLNFQKQKSAMSNSDSFKRM